MTSTKQHLDIGKNLIREHWNPWILSRMTYVFMYRNDVKQVKSR